MGNVGSSGSNNRGGGGSVNLPVAPPPPPENAANPPPPPPPAPCGEHQKGVVLKSHINIKKETLRIEPDEENPGHFLVSFTFDALVSGSITVVFFAKEGEGCVLTPTKENVLAPITVNFLQGFGQKFRQPAGAGINFSMLEESELLKVGDMDVYPVAVKADASFGDQDGSNETPTSSGNTNSMITQAVFEKEKGEFRVKVVKQIVWVNGMRCVLQEIYGRGIGFSVEGHLEECVICLSEPRDTFVFPCRHMCMCRGCAEFFRFQEDRCPICRQPVERLCGLKLPGK